MNGFEAMRRRAGFTQESAAARLSLDRSTISKWETGEAFPRGETLKAVSELYGCSIDDLFRPAEVRL